MKRQVDIAPAERNTFFNDAIATYGRAGALAICQSIIVTADFAHKELPMVRPMNTLGVGIHKISTESRPVRGFSDPEKDEVNLYFDPTVSTNDVLEDLVRVMMHECTHLAHRQHNPTFRNDATILGLTNFGYAIEEGLGDAVEGNFLDKEGFICDLTYSPEGLGLVHGGLEGVLFDDEIKSQEYYEFLFGDKAFPYRGYEVGLYVVVSMAMYTGYSTEELLRAPVAEYREFAENYL